MREHRYMAENLGRRTYLKGSFTGRFVGRLDPYQSDARHERFFDIEVTEGEIVTRQDQVNSWQDEEEDQEFAKESSLHVKLPGKINVTLHYLDGSVKHFKVNLKEIKLLRCGLSNKVYNRDEVHGTIRGEVLGYVLHHETIFNEILENGPEKVSINNTSNNKGSLGITSGTSVPQSPVSKGFNVLKLFFFLFAALFGLALIVSNNWLPVATCFLIGGLAVLWQYKKGPFGENRRQLLAILLYGVLFAVGLGWILSNSIGIKRLTEDEVIKWKQKGEIFLKEKNYRGALDAFSILALQDESYPSELISQTLTKAVNDLKPLIAEGDTAAIRLYNAVNPVKQKQTGTVIRCRDGTISNSKHRRGTCSHHGGVKDWEEPVYEEYRKYK